MNAPYYGHRLPSPVDGEKTDPVVNNDVFADNVPVVAGQMHETPLGGTVAAVAPMNGQLVDEIPAGETGTPVNLMDGKMNREESIPYHAPVPETIYQAPVAAKVESSASLLTHEDSEHFRTRWNEIQGTFVDEPRAAVQQADALVSEVIGQISKMFASNHSALESQWKQGNDVSTEDLRKALQSYRSFFNRLVV